MSCLNINITKVNPVVAASVSRLGEPLNVMIGRLGQSMKANVSLVCSPNTDAYIRVTPKTLWLFTENDVANVEVFSNIKWIVK